MGVKDVLDRVEVVANTTAAADAYTDAMVHVKAVAQEHVIIHVRGRAREAVQDKITYNTAWW